MFSRESGYQEETPLSTRFAISIPQFIVEGMFDPARDRGAGDRHDAPLAAVGLTVEHHAADQHRLWSTVARRPATAASSVRAPGGGPE